MGFILRTSEVEMEVEREVKGQGLEWALMWSTSKEGEANLQGLGGGLLSEHISDSEQCHMTPAC